MAINPAGHADADNDHRVPGMGAALLIVLAMLVMSAVLFAMIYGLMLAITPIDARQPAAIGSGYSGPLSKPGGTARPPAPAK